MSQVDLDRVQEVRRRLQGAESAIHGFDAAVRIVELFSPNVGEPSLLLHQNFSVVAGLSNAARQAIAATIDGVRRNDGRAGLDGMVESNGRRSRMYHHLNSTEMSVPGSALVPTPSLFNRVAHSQEAAELQEIIETIDRAVMLSSAELRGADDAAARVDAEVHQLSTRSRNAGLEMELYDAIRLSEDEQMLEALESVALPAATIQQLERASDALRNDVERTRLQAACSQAAAARAQALPTDGRQVNMLAELAVAEAEGVLAEHDMLPGSTAQILTDLLAEIGIETTAFEAPETADRIIRENAELEQIRSRLLDTIDRPVTSPEVDRMVAERTRIEGQRREIQRHLRSQQQLLAVARTESTRLGLGPHSFDEDGGRQTPILIEDPFDDLPARLSGAILAVLVRHSARAQVICVSDQLDLRKWCSSVGERAGWVQASNWFADKS